MDIDSVLRDELTEPQYDAATAAEPEVLASVEPDGAAQALLACQRRAPDQVLGWYACGGRQPAVESC